LGAIHVKKPFQGTIKINEKLCPDGCRACIDICRTNAIELNKKGKPVVSSDYCIFCSACQKVCPKEAIDVKRSWVFHSDIKAAAWLTALKKLTSEETVIRELQGKSSKKKRSMVKKRRLDQK
jgi:4Fe-4S ferredoxin